MPAAIAATKEPAYKPLRKAVGDLNHPDPDLAPKKHGFNIEGLAVSQDGEALLIGLRNPHPHGEAILFRVGVPPGKLLRGNKRVLDIAELEVNGLSDCSVKIEPVRRNPRAPITAVTVTWWRKEGDAYRDTLRELRQPKVGRMARLKGTVETIGAPGKALST